MKQNWLAVGLTYAEITEIDAAIRLDSAFDPTLRNNLAAQRICTLARSLLEGEILDQTVVVLIGEGEKAVIGVAVAQQLHEAGSWVQTVCVRPLPDDASTLATQLRALQESGAPLAWAEEGWELPPCDLLIDALIGCELQEDPQGKLRELILLANSNAAPILSVDMPSGIDCQTGALYYPHIVAATTMMLGFPRQCILTQPANAVCGDLFLADIALSPEVCTKYHMIPAPSFDKNGLLSCGCNEGYK